MLKDLTEKVDNVNEQMGNINNNIKGHFKKELNGNSKNEKYHK